MGESRTFWSTDDVAKIAREEGINLVGRCAISAVNTSPPGITREQVAESLRHLTAVPDEWCTKGGSPHASPDECPPSHLKERK